MGALPKKKMAVKKVEKKVIKKVTAKKEIKAVAKNVVEKKAPPVKVKEDKKANKVQAKAAPAVKKNEEVKKVHKVEAKGKKQLELKASKKTEGAEGETQIDGTDNELSENSSLESEKKTAMDVIEAPPVVRNFRHNHDIEALYRFIHENDLRREAKMVIEHILTLTTKKRTPREKKVH